MNVENITILRDHVAGLPSALFNMDSWGAGGCGTPACLGGWTLTLFGDDKSGFLTERAGNALGLPAKAASALFYPEAAPVEQWTEITTSQAVRVLDHLLATGEVDWSIIDGEAA